MYPHSWRSSFICIFVILLVFQTRAQVDLNNGLVAYLPFNASMADASGNGNNGIPQGTFYTTDRFGNPNKAVLLNGAGDYIAIKDPMQKFSNTPFSLVIWFQTNSFADQVFIGKRDFGPTNGQQYQFGLRSVQGITSTVVSSALPCPGDLRPDVMDQISYPDPFCRDSWHVAVVTFDGSFHRIYFDGRKVAERTASFSTMMKCTSDLRLGNWWGGDPQSFNGKLDEFRWYNRVLNQAEIDLIASDKAAPPTVDFSFIQQVCDPARVKLTNMSTITSNILWRLGDGNVSTLASPDVTYAAPGKYNVTLVVNNGNVCVDSVTKATGHPLSPQNIILTPDTSICGPDSARLRTIPSLGEFCWNPDPVRPDLTKADGAVAPAATTTYRLRGLGLAAETVTNGSFTAGDANFISSYAKAPTLTADGQYSIQSNAKAWFPAAVCTACGDRTGSGQFLIADGSTDPSLPVWCQDVPVQSGITYQLSFWMASFSTSGAPNPAVYIDGLMAGDITVTPAEAGTWKKFSVYWTPKSTGTANVCIRNRSSLSGGNVFGLDDVSLRPSSFVSDSVTVSRSTGKLTVTKDTSICSGTSLQLSVTGGSAYQWTPASGLSDPASANPVASPNATTKYYVVSSGQCPGRDSVTVSLAPNPKISAGADLVICPGGTAQLNAEGGISYRWSPAAGLSDPAIQKPKASPSATTIYQVVGTDTRGCRDSAKVEVEIGTFREVYVPNAFTPNGDGINDCFRIPDAVGGTVYELAIYNRFGERIFFSTDPARCWDGNFKGMQLPGGNYHYYLKVDNGCGYQFRKGAITLIR